MKPKGTRWCRVTDNTKYFNGETLWQIEYNNGTLGGFIGEDVSLPDAFCRIYENSKILKGSKIVGTVLIENTTILENTIIGTQVCENDACDGIKIFNSTIGGKFFLRKGIVENSRLLGEFNCFAFSFYMKNSFFSEKSSLFLSDNISSACLKNIIATDETSISSVCSNNNKIYLEMHDSCLYGKASVSVGKDMTITNTTISDSAVVINASLYDCSIIQNAKIAYVTLDNCAINCDVGYSQSGEPITGASSVMLSDISTIDDGKPKKTVPVFINTYNEGSCLTYYTKNDGPVFFHCKREEKHRYDEKISLIIMIKKHILFMTNEKENDLVFRDFDYFAGFIKAIKNVFRNIEDKPLFDVVSCAFNYSYYVMLRNYYLESFDNIIGDKIYDEYFLLSKKMTLEYKKTISSFTFVDILNKEIKIDKEKYIITDMVLDTFKNKEQAKALLEKDERFVFL